MVLGDDAVEVGRVLRTHGLEGELVVRCFHEDPGVLLRAHRVLLDADPGRIPYVVLEARPLDARRDGVRILLRLLGLETRERARVWQGAAVRLEPDALAPGEADEVRWGELVGLACVTVEGRPLGTVREIWPTPTCDQLLVSDGERELFVPARDAVLVAIDREARCLTVDLGPAGLGLEEAEEDGPEADGEPT